MKKKKSLIVFYDSWCPLCMKAKGNIEAFDKKNRIELLTFRDQEIFERYQLSNRNVENRIYSLNTHSNKSYSGIETILQIAMRIPKYYVFVPFIYISIILGFGSKLYDYIASKRNVVPVGHCNEEYCPIHVVKGGDENSN